MTDVRFVDVRESCSHHREPRRQPVAGPDGHRSRSIWRTTMFRTTSTASRTRRCSGAVAAATAAALILAPGVAFAAGQPAAPGTGHAGSHRPSGSQAARWRGRRVAGAMPGGHGGAGRGGAGKTGRTPPDTRPPARHGGHTAAQVTAARATAAPPRCRSRAAAAPDTRRPGRCGCPRSEGRHASHQRHRIGPAARQPAAQRRDRRRRGGATSKNSAADQSATVTKLSVSRRPRKTAS